MPVNLETFLAQLNDESPQSPERQEVLRQIVARIVELAKVDEHTSDLQLASTAVDELIEASLLFAKWRDRPKVTVFGSARTKDDAPLYELARQFGDASSAMGWMTVSGAGPGIMEASAKGAGRDHTLGVNIDLPFEQGANPYINTDEMHVEMKFFFTRKVALTRASHAFVVFPGGVGTMDELFEILTLIHTGKTNPAPIILMDLVDGTFWKQWMAFMDVLVKDQYIDDADRCLYALCTSVQDAISHIQHFYKNYQSFRVDEGRATISLRHEPTPRLVEEATHAFPSFVVDQGFVVEGNTLSFDFDGRNYVRLRLFIDFLNDAAN
jgi:hypothetical protein